MKIEPSPVVAEAEGNASNWGVRLAYGIGLLLALGFAYGTWMQVEEHMRLVQTGVVAQGMIVGVNETRSRGRGSLGTEQYVSHRPMISYRTADGTQVETAARQKMERSEIHVGQAVRVVYDPADRKVVYLASVIDEGVGFTPWLLGIVAALLAFVCGYQLLRRRR